MRGALVFASMTSLGKPLILAAWGSSISIQSKSAHDLLTAFPRSNLQNQHPSPAPSNKFDAGYWTS